MKKQKNLPNGLSAINWFVCKSLNYLALFTVNTIKMTSSVKIGTKQNILLLLLRIYSVTYNRLKYFNIPYKPYIQMTFIRTEKTETEMNLSALIDDRTRMVNQFELQSVATC